MAEAFNLLKRVRSLEVSPELSGYSGVRIYAGQDDEGNSIEYFAGNTTGKILEIINDWGTQAQADAISKKILGYRYQPYTAIGSQIDPSVELGDAVTVSDTYGGVFSRRSIYGKHIISDVSAPVYDEIEHEFQIQSPTNRQYDRFTRQMRASLSITNAKILAEVSDRKSDVQSLTSKILIEANRITQEVTARQNDVNSINSKLTLQAGQIAAKVSKTGGSPSSFGWTLTDSDWTIKANNQNILRATKSGLEVYGKVTATSGKIGGFDINTNYLSYNNQVWGGTNSTGIYIGISGIQLGKYFKVDSAGNLTARSGRFEGTVYAGNIQYGETGGYFSGSGISSGSIYGNRMVANTISTAYTSGGINTSLGYADYANGVFNGWNTAAQLKTGAQGLSIGGHTVQVASTSFSDGSGNTISLKYLTWI